MKLKDTFLNNSSNLTADLNSGFLIFLITLPLCMAIAVASGCPPVAGIITSIIGGLVTGIIGGAKLSIKGAPAGLIVIVLAAVHELGSATDPMAGYRAALAVGLCAGVIQVLIGGFKLGKLIDFIPAAVVHGMISAIGFIVVAKQMYPMLGLPNHGGSPMQLVIDFFGLLGGINPLIAVIGVSSLLVMACSIQPSFKRYFKLPGALVVLLMSITLSAIFGIGGDNGYSAMGNNHPLGSQFLIHLPASLLSGITTPDWMMISSLTFWKFVLLFAVIGSIESLLTVKAINKSQTAADQANLNKDLISTGIANILTSYCGGIPMISEIGRSRANVDFGAKSALSNFLHGALILLAVSCIPGVLGLVPIAALSGILIMIGCRLFAVQEWRHAWHQGQATFAVYLTTFLLTVTVDLLAGVFCGFILYLVFEGFKCHSIKRIFWPNYQIEAQHNHSIICFTDDLLYTNLPQVKKVATRELNLNKSVLLDCQQCSYIEKEFMEELETFIEITAGSKIRLVQ